MPSTYSPSLKLQLIGTGEQAGTWGTTTNYNLGTLLEQAITGVVTIPMGDANYTMTNYNGLSDEARNAVLVLNGPITSPQNLIAPPQQKVYIVRNFTGNTVTIRTATGNGVALTNAASAVVFCDGTDFYSATTLNYIDGNLTVTGDTALYGNVSMANATNASVTIYADNVYGNVSSGQWFLPTGNTTVRTSNPVNGLLRYNTELNIYEGYQNSTWVKFITANELNYTINYLIVAGGGGGGASGGGGGGGFSASSVVLTSGATYSIIVGSGGAGGISSGDYQPNGTAGTNSSITGIASTVGGGYGAGAQSNGGNGGSGGGGGRLGEPTPTGGSGGTGTAGQGYGGGQGTTYTGGGGGGASAAGSTGGGDSAGAGGAGSPNTLTGTTVYYAGGGGGGGGTVGGAGGTGGGGNGGGVAGGGANGTANTGGGGGNGGNGGSGIVVLQIPTISYTGITTGSPSVSVSGANTILRYTSSGTYTA